MKNLIFTLSLILFTCVLYAQEMVFQTLATRGTCMVQRGANPDKYENLKTGAKLYEDDKIIITGDESYLGLVSVSGGALELAKGGVYDVNSLQNSLVNESSNIAEKYVEFLMEDMSKNNESIALNMKYTGSVERSTTNNNIDLFLPKESKIASEATTIYWNPKEGQESYMIKISNMFDELVYSSKTDSTGFRVNFGEIDLANDETFLMKVESTVDASYSSSTVSLHMPEKGVVESLRKEVESIKSETPEGSAIREMILAKYFQEKELYVNAIPHYQAAISMQPDVMSFRKAYNAFLTEIGLDPLN